jgi:anti-anti-sigma factor
MIKFNVKTSEIEEIHHVLVNGDLDNETYVAVENQLKELLEKEEPLKVLIDFTGVDGFCSAAEYVLLWANTKIKENGGKLALLCGNQNVMELMVAFGLNKIIKTFDDRNEALKYLNQ